MNTIEPRNPFFERALAEHRQLHELLLRVQSVVEQTAAMKTHAEQWPEVVEALAGLLAHVEEHFAEEEAGGCLEEAATRLPRLGPQVTSLERQHEPLRRQLSDLVEQARQTKAPCDRLAQDFARFVEALLSHEAAEIRLLEEGFGRELS